MSRFVVDASISMAWCFEDEAPGYPEKVLGALEDHEAVVPGIWTLEVANVLLVAERRGRLRPTDSSRFLQLLSALPIRTVEETPERVRTIILGLGRTHGLTSYDATYLDLAMREGLPLATMDRELRKAAEACGVTLFEP